MGFSFCHPAINMIYFSCVIISALWIDHPIYLAISLICAFIYSVKLNRIRGAVLGLCLIPCAAAFALWYAGHHHFGVTVLRQNFVKNNITLEASIYGFVMGMMAANGILWLSCVHKIFTTDKIVYLFGRVSPRLSLFLSILLRAIPRIGKQAGKLNSARQGIGRGVNQGNVFRRFRNAICVLSMMLTWTIEMFTGISESMRSRGSSLRGRTAFSIYRFDNRDRAYVVALFAAMTALVMGVLLKQNYARYTPAIRVMPPTPTACVFYIAYGALCLMPVALDVFTEWNFRRSRKNVQDKAA